MLFLRNVIDNNRVLTSILVISFCLFFGLHHAFALGKVISGGLTALSIIGLIKSAIKSLDEQIEIKEAEVLWLGKLKEEWWKEYKRREVTRKRWVREVKAAQTAYDQAVTNYNSAVSAEKAAGSAYRAAKRHAAAALRDYLNHIRWCSECSPVLCPTGSQLKETWLSAARAEKEAKQAWDEAKTNLSAAEAAKKAAYERLYEAKGNLGRATTASNNALKQWRAIGKAHAEAAGELSDLIEEKELQLEKLKEAMKQLNNAKQQLDIAEQDYPDEWAEIMSDPDLRQAVEEIRSY